MEIIFHEDDLLEVVEECIENKLDLLIEEGPWVEVNDEKIVSINAIVSNQKRDQNG